MLTKGLSQQWRILIINWIGWPILWTPVNLFCQPPLSSLNGLMEKRDHGDRNGGYTWAQQHALPHAMANLAMAIAECQFCQQQRWTLSPRHGTIHGGDQPATSLQVDYIRKIPMWWKGQCFALTRIDTYSGYRYAILHALLLPKLYPWTYRINSLSTVMVFHTVLLMIKELAS